MYCIRSFAASFTLAIPFMIIVASFVGCSNSNSYNNSDAQWVNDSDAQWVDAWANSHLSTSVTKNTLAVQATNPDEFHDQTLRLILWSQVSGNSIRVRFTNQFGLTPLHINAAHIAIHRAKGDIQIGSDRELTFAGKKLTVIPVNEERWSDPVDLAVTQHQEIAVSIYIAGDYKPTQFHPTGLMTSYVFLPTGNLSGEVNAPEKIQTTTMNFFVNNLQVKIKSKTKSKTKLIITLGDSITDGCCVAADTHTNWPDRLAKKLAQNNREQQFSVINMGIGSNRFCASDGAGPSAIHRFEHDVLARSAVSYLIMMEGINDISYEHISPNQLIDCYKNAIAQARKAGIKVFMSPLLPIKHSVKDTPENEYTRATVNQWIRSTSALVGGPDAVIDFESAVWDDADHLSIKKEFTSDFVHPNEQGYAAMVAAIDPTLF